MRRLRRTLRIILCFCGPLLIAFGSFLLAPLLVALVYGEYREDLLTVWGFLLSGGFASPLEF